MEGQAGARSFKEVQRLHECHLHWPSSCFFGYQVYLILYKNNTIPKTGIRETLRHGPLPCRQANPLLFYLRVLYFYLPFHTQYQGEVQIGTGRGSVCRHTLGEYWMALCLFHGIINQICCHLFRFCYHHPVHDLALF